MSSKPGYGCSCLCCQARACTILIAHSKCVLISVRSVRQLRAAEVVSCAVLMMIQGSVVPIIRVRYDGGVTSITIKM